MKIFLLICVIVFLLMLISFVAGMAVQKKNDLL